MGSCDNPWIISWLNFWIAACFYSLKCYSIDCVLDCAGSTLKTFIASWNALSSSVFYTFCQAVSIVGTFPVFIAEMYDSASSISILPETVLPFNILGFTFLRIFERRESI